MSNNCSNVNIDISLIIDDSKTAKVTIDLNNADDNYISSLCEELSNKFSLDEQVKNNVYIQIQNIINKIKKSKIQKKILMKLLIDYIILILRKEKKILKKILT